MKLDYNEWVILDAEALAEAGIGEAYRRLLPKLKLYVQDPARLEEVIDNDCMHYAVHCNDKEYVIYSPDIPGSDMESWERATCFFFSIVNEQLEQSNVRFYAINGGNDLGGMFLTPEQALASRAGLPDKTDWPYIPDLNEPWIGQFH